MMRLPSPWYGRQEDEGAGLETLGQFPGFGTGLGLRKIPAYCCAVSELLTAWLGFCFPRGRVLGGVGVWEGVWDNCWSPGSLGAPGVGKPCCYGVW